MKLRIFVNLLTIAIYSSIPQNNNTLDQAPANTLGDKIAKGHKP
jgi:hypothetical protein